MRLAAIALSAVLAGGYGLTFPPGQAGADGSVPPVVEAALPEAAQPAYANLAELSASICTGAAAVFRNFFDSSPVEVRPFIHVSALANNSSVLGVTLADQLAAALNAHANAVSGTARRRSGQRLEGVMQEVDGHLRIHVLGTNSHGERLSHVALVEMSAPLYRALHTYADKW